MKNPNVIEVVFDVSLAKLNGEQEAQLFKEMVGQTTTDLALKYGFDKKYKDLNQARAAVYQIYRKVLKSPALWGIGPDVVDVVQNAVENRKAGNHNKKMLLDDREKKEYIREALGKIRDKSAKIIDLKLDRGLMSKKERENISLKDLSVILSMAVDKGRLLGGESTENILHYAKLDKNVSPEEALSIVLKAREALIENKK